MAHYFMQDGYNRVAEQMKELTEDELAEAKEDFIQLLTHVVSGDVQNFQVENAIAREDYSFNPYPETIQLRNVNGLSTKILGDTLYLGTNGDWVNFSMVYDIIGIDWKAYFED